MIYARHVTTDNPCTMDTGHLCPTATGTGTCTHHDQPARPGTIIGATEDANKNIVKRVSPESADIIITLGSMGHVPVAVLTTCISQGWTRGAARLQPSGGR